MSDLIKQTIVVRHDLKMRMGKVAAQASHASISFLTRKIQRNQKLSEVEEKWTRESFTKICLRVDSEEQLIDIYNKALAAKLEVHLITDAGKTEFNGVPTKTCLAIGPDYSSKIDPITKDLKLL
jgi:PTH2 family peptidyl-tRNA hydrolase